MKRKHFKGNMSMLLIVIAAIVLYGCSGDGGSTSGSGSEKTVELAFDTDKDGTPDILDDHPDNANSNSHPVCDELDYPTTHDSLGTAIGKDTPYSAQTTFKGTIDSANSSDYFAVALEAGKTYSMVFHDPQEMDGRALTFAPDAAVYTGNFNYLLGIEDEEPLQGKVLAKSSVISDSEKLPLEFSPEGESQVAILSFTPQESRVHYIAIRSGQTVDQGTSHQYRFDLIEDHDKDGSINHYEEAGAGNYIYNNEDILLLKSSIAPHVTEWASDGSPKTFGAGAQTAFESTVSYLAAVRAEPESSDQTSLNPFVADIPWNSDYKFGYGIDASTGLPASLLQAVTSFTPPVPANASTTTDTQIFFINSDAQHSKEIQTAFNTTFSCYGVTVKASGSYADNIKYSEKETTLILEYYKKETEYRIFDPAGGAYTLTDNAKTYLNERKDDFRNKYGDYFIAGAKYGAKYVAAIHIKASSAEEIRKIEAEISQAIPAYDANATEKFKATFSAATKNSSVEVKRTTIGGNDTLLSAGTTPEQMFDELKIFIQSCTKDSLAPLQAYMFRFNQMPDGASIATNINVNPGVFSATRELTKDYLALSSRSKVLAGLDISTFQAGVQDDYKQECDALINEINDNRQVIFRDINKIKAYGTRVKTMLDAFSGLIDRQSFFLKLVKFQKDWLYHTEHQSRESGFKSYYMSRAVDNDISKPSKTETFNAEYHQGWHIGWRSWSTSWTPGSNSIVCYIKIDIDPSTKNDDCWDTNYPSLGRDHLSFDFKSGYDRMGSWWLKAKGVYLGENGKGPAGNYPFNWEMML